MVWVIRVLLAIVWIVYGLFFKVMGLVPRHQSIVAVFLGEWARPATILIGTGEVFLGLWVLTGYRPRTCMAVLTCAIVSMNTLELLFARDLLLAPALMLVGNGFLLAAGWWAAMHSPGTLLSNTRALSRSPTGR